MKNTQFFETRENASNQNSETDIPGPLNELLHVNSRNLRRNSISLPTGLNTVDIEALHRAHIDDKIKTYVSSHFINVIFHGLLKEIIYYKVESRDSPTLLILNGPNIKCAIFILERPRD